MFDLYRYGWQKLLCIVLIAKYALEDGNWKLEFEIMNHKALIDLVSMYLHDRCLSIWTDIMAMNSTSCHSKIIPQ